MTDRKKCRAPFCMKYSGHDGPHVVPPKHPILSDLTFRCSWPECGYLMHDAAYWDVEDHWHGHVRCILEAEVGIQRTDQLLPPELGIAWEPDAA